MHYNRAWYSGRHAERPRELVSPDATLEERLRHHGWTVEASGCWTWRGALNGHGYGQLAVGAARPEIASRAAYMAWVGPLADGAVVCHRCDNPPCINPAHLFIGTRGDNNQDMAAKGRHAHGARAPYARLTDADVFEIRRRYAAGGIRYVDLADEYGVSKSEIGHVVLGKRWRHSFQS